MRNLKIVGIAVIFFGVITLLAVEVCKEIDEHNQWMAENMTSLLGR
jgi:hypothetical protein